MGVTPKSAPKPIASEKGQFDTVLGLPAVAENSPGFVVSHEQKQQQQASPMMVVVGSKRTPDWLINLRQRLRRRYWAWIASAVLLCGLLIVWNVKAIMVPTSETMTVPKFTQQPRKDSVAAADAENGQESVPAQVPKSDTLPSPLKTFVPLNAAEALQCRDSVVSFVINATDGKDECEGLKKAFDKTCGDQVEIVAPAEEKQNTKRKPKAPPKKHRFGEKAKGGRKKPGPAKKTTPRSGRILSEKVVTHSMPAWRRCKLWLYQTRQMVLAWWRHWFEGEKDFLFAEDEILRVWDDAEILVADGLDGVVYAELTRQWQEEKRRHWHRSQRRRLQEGVAANQSSAANTTVPLTNNKTKPSVNLALPTLKKHASGEVIQDVLLLKQGDKLINQTNAAAQEAAVSSKAMSDTAAAVSAVLNDPTSVEARTCCTSILNVYHENCSTDEEEQISDRRLFLMVLVIASCGMVKSLIRHYRILWLPEAAGCIIVGVISGYILMFIPHHDLSFDGNWFLRIMVPPIIFEAALSIDKRSFHRHLFPILLYAVVGTLMATFITAEILHRGSTMLPWCTAIPYVEALTFGALISSIDPIAVLSVLSNMGMTDKDTIYVLIFGESLLNDGVAIVLFETLVHFLDEHLIIDDQAVVEAAIHFTVVALGSVLVGAVAGYASTIYFWLFEGCQTPLVEVLMFLCWALLPYYVCDGMGWSGIVSTVATGIIMDIHIVGHRMEDADADDTSANSQTRGTNTGSPQEVFTRIFSNVDGHLSVVARAHIGFVTGLIATTLETAIFAYLGFFLFSHRYHWSFLHALIAILACCLSRGFMIPSLSFFANMFTTVQRKAKSACQVRPEGAPTGGGVVIDRKMQFVLWFGGLRGAMSFALVESIPLYDSVSGEGTPLKPELKAMTSACIMFTVFVLGGYTFYVMEHLGMTPGKSPKDLDAEMVLLNGSGDDEEIPEASLSPNGVATNRRRPRSN